MDTRYQGSPNPVTVHQLSRAKISDGKSVSVTVPAETTIVAGQWALLDGFLGVAMQGVVTGENETQEVILTIEQAEYETDQINVSQSFAKGAAIYWNNSTKRFTETAEGNRLAGRVTSAKDTNNVIWFILGPQIPAYPTVEGDE